MSELAKKKPKSRDKAVKKKKLQPAKDQLRDSDDIERAVYDGMQDLRAIKSK